MNGEVDRIINIIIIDDVRNNNRNSNSVQKYLQVVSKIWGYPIIIFYLRFHISLNHHVWVLYHLSRIFKNKSYIINLINVTFMLLFIFVIHGISIVILHACICMSERIKGLSTIHALTRTIIKKRHRSRRVLLKFKQFRYMNCHASWITFFY